MIAAALFFLGQFALFTYLRPFLETVTQVDVSTISALLLALGIAGLLGTSLVGLVLRRHLYSSLVIMPVTMALIAIGLTILRSSLGATTALISLWGFIGTAAPAGWWNLLSRRCPTSGSRRRLSWPWSRQHHHGRVRGRRLFDSSGYQATFLFSAVVLCLSAVVILVGAFGRQARDDCETCANAANASI